MKECRDCPREIEEGHRKLCDDCKVKSRKKTRAVTSKKQNEELRKSRKPAVQVYKYDDDDSWLNA